MASTQFIAGVFAVSLVLTGAVSPALGEDGSQQSGVKIEPVVIPAPATQVSFSDHDGQHDGVEVVPTGVPEIDSSVIVGAQPIQSCDGGCDGGCDGNCNSCCGSSCGHPLLSRLKVVCPKPSCYMSQHTPYCSPGNYYYFRPYHPMNIETQRQQSLQWNAPVEQPYSNAHFQDVYESIESDLGLNR